MKRKKVPSKKKGEMTRKSKKQKLEFIIESLSHGWLADERETSILYVRSEKRVYLETSVPATARRWFEIFWGVDNVKWSTNSDTLKLSVPRDYCRYPDMIIKPEFRNKKD